MPKWIFAALFAVVVGAVAALTHQTSPGPSPVARSGARGAGPREGRGLFPGDFASETRRGSIASAESAPGSDAPGAAGTPAAASELDQELDATLRALDSSHRLSEPPLAAPLPDPPQPAPGRSGRRVPIVARCGGAGLGCRSSADCCPGLACTGGVAGYGTSGVCESS